MLERLFVMVARESSTMTTVQANYPGWNDNIKD